MLDFEIQGPKHLNCPKANEKSVPVAFFFWIYRQLSLDFDLLTSHFSVLKTKRPK